MHPEDAIIRPLTRDELDIAVEWAAAEGWNPGVHDAEVFWNCDPEGFLGMELEGELIASGSIVSYGGEYGFMGFFIVKPELRGKGLGTKLWFHRRDTLKSRLAPSAAIGMDGVFDMQAWYAKGGFRFSHRNLRLQGKVATGSVHEAIAPLGDVPFVDIMAYDHACFGVSRERFIEGWIKMPGSLALGFVRDGSLSGYGVIRACREGFKIGPLYADDAEIAEALFIALGNHADGATVALDVPETHKAAMQLAARHGLREVFGCARMYFGDPPPMDWNRTFGITTFELG